MSDSRFFLGVDGGGTKTEFVCMNEGGQVVARTVTGTTYHLQVGYEEAVERIRVGVGGICAELAITPAAFAYAFFGLPAFGEDAMIDPLLDQACGRILGHDRYRCGNDMVCGWAGSLACEDGINLVAGTGSIGYGERQGRSARIGGWGEMFSDEGSAYWIAIRGLNAFTRMSDGRLPAGPLLGGFRQTLGLTNDLDLCAMIMGDQGMARDDVAGLAKIVSQAGEAGDIAACLILDDAGRELATMARSLRDILGFPADEATPLSWSGGVLTGQKLVSDALARHLGEGFVLIEPRHPPGNGAALYARLLGGR